MPPTINIVTRAEWMAKPPSHQEKLNTPVDTVLILYTGAADRMNEKEVCSTLASLQQISMKENNEYDIPYNWLVDYHGTIYEGRGWKTNVQKTRFSPYYHLNKKSLDIGLVGNFADKNPPKFMYKVVTKLIEWGMTEKFIVDNRHLKVYNWKDFPI